MISQFSVTDQGFLTSNYYLARGGSSQTPRLSIYKLYPDVETGHRKSFVSEAVIRQIADEAQRDVPFAAFIDAARAVHLITSPLVTVRTWRGHLQASWRRRAGRR